METDKRVIFKSPTHIHTSMNSWWANTSYYNNSFRVVGLSNSLSISTHLANRWNIQVNLWLVPNNQFVLIQNDSHHTRHKSHFSILSTEFNEILKFSKFAYGLLSVILKIKLLQLWLSRMYVYTLYYEQEPEFNWSTVHV